jgi:hypothetical protein
MLKMGTSRVGFLDGILVMSPEEEQKRVAEENINKRLFRIIDSLNLENGDVIELSPIAEKIANDIGIEKEKIINHITQLFQSGRYQFSIDDNGNIIANYNRLYMIQLKEAREGCQAAEKKMQEYIQLVRKYIGNLEGQKITITREAIISQFDEGDLRKNPIWIDLAIESVTGEKIPMKFDNIETYRDEL